MGSWCLLLLLFFVSSISLLFTEIIVVWVLVVLDWVSLTSFRCFHILGLFGLRENVYRIGGEKPYGVLDLRFALSKYHCMGPRDRKRIEEKL